MTTQIRPYQPSDEAAVLQIWRDCGLTRPVNDPRKDIARKLAKDPELFLVAEQGGVLVGTVMAGYEGHRGWINYLGVAPAHQKSGLGRQLMQAAETRLRALGCPKINLQVRRDNAEVRAFYERLGFSEDPVASYGKRLERDEAL